MQSSRPGITRKKTALGTIVNRKALGKNGSVLVRLWKGTVEWMQQLVVRIGVGVKRTPAILLPKKFVAKFTLAARQVSAQRVTLAFVRAIRLIVSSWSGKYRSLRTSLQ